MDPLAERILVEIQRTPLSSADRQKLAAALREARDGHRSVTAKWDTPLDFLVDLCEWVAELPPEHLPPREGDAAAHFGCTKRTIGRWLERARVEGWDGFLRFWALANRGD
jgi:hypothetical protein